MLCQTQCRNVIALVDNSGHNASVTWLCSVFIWECDSLKGINNAPTWVGAVALIYVHIDILRVEKTNPDKGLAMLPIGEMPGKRHSSSEHC